MEDEICNNLQEFIDWHFQTKEKWLFRGHSKESYKLVPKIARKKKGSKIVSEKALKKREDRLGQALSIRLPAYGYDFHILRENHRKWKEYFIAQHYGAPTRLLDFTRNPLVALFFCVISDNDSNGTVYAAKTINEKRKKNIFDYLHIIKQYNPKEIEKTCFIVPPQIDQRIINQQSVFCCFKNPIKLLTDESNNFVFNNKNMVRKIIINKNKKNQIREELNKVGINHAILFPDLIGCCEFIKWRVEGIL